MRTIASLFTALVLIASAAAADWAGTYKGTWTGGQADGDFTLIIRPGDDGASKAEVSFTIAGQDVKCHVTSVKLNDTKIEVVYEFELGDTKLQSTVTGELNGKTVQGSYKTKSLSDGSAVDEGTWKATAA